MNYNGPKRVYKKKSAIEQCAEKNGYKVILYAPYANHPQDDYLYWVLCEHKEGNGYVIWLANVSGTPGLGEGKYYNYGDNTALLKCALAKLSELIQTRGKF